MKGEKIDVGVGGQCSGDMGLSKDFLFLEGYYVLLYKRHIF